MDQSGKRLSPSYPVVQVETTQLKIWSISEFATVIGGGAPLVRRRGGLPIIRAGQVEGALGVSGAHSNEQDEECALAGIGVLEKCNP